MLVTLALDCCLTIVLYTKGADFQLQSAGEIMAFQFPCTQEIHYLYWDSTDGQHWEILRIPYGHAQEKYGLF